MKKKVIMAMVVVMAMATLPCFAEIRVDRGGYTENGFSCNVAIYWNDKYGHPLLISAKGVLKYFKDGLGHGFKGTYELTAHCYYDQEGFYEVDFERSPDGTFLVQADYNYDNDYEQKLYENSYKSHNAAKAQFDSLCRQCYDRIAK